MIREKKHRLQLDCYKGRVAVVFTICIANKNEAFVSSDVVSVMEEILHDCLKKFSCCAHVYLFMPEHVHLLLEGQTINSDVWKCVVWFKQKSGYWFYKYQHGIKWQKDFYDHILRKDEDIKKHVRYILENPVRKGIVKNWKEYPFKGSTVYGFDEW